MFFNFVGIPDVFEARFRSRSLRELSGHHFSFVPLRMDHSKSHRLSVEHLQANIESIVHYSRGRQNCFDKGAAVVVLKYKWDNLDSVPSFFFPFAPVVILEITEPFAQTGNRAAVQANKIITDLHSLARKVIAPIDLMGAELRARLKRTPVLLPVRRFDAKELVLLFEELAVAIGVGGSGTFIRDACSRFEQAFPYQRDRRNSGKFVNGRGIDFYMPGRAMHGNIWDGETGNHTNECYLGARLRLGAPFNDGFHFDCCHNDGPYMGELENCHDEKKRYRGHPHLNIYPNDFIRGG
ncbi:hypothetical protein [Bradyrhizobium sp. CCBAU 21360]|uniref:hypothetical protein n=1 Tax=Bradyrhizobium sp. CCBAU 21360 TaxID=1325081 RepID=UPI00230522E1|nr:hypothetical protein [Bradyrhizobium sp. CCBAU 21360]MDA9450762.1 hypothetical protein [Bradyrhizobium sp. CCBAU 21360]